MAAQKSGLVRFMKGRLYPGVKDTSAIRDITKSRDGKTRIIHLENGLKVRQSKAQVLKAFHKELSAHQASVARRSMRETPKGVAVTLGGTQKGVRKVFATKAAAKAAITRKYGRQSN